MILHLCRQMPDMQTPMDISSRGYDQIAATHPPNTLAVCREKLFMNRAVITAYLQWNITQFTAKFQIQSTRYSILVKGTKNFHFSEKSLDSGGKAKHLYYRNNVLRQYNHNRDKK